MTRIGPRDKDPSTAKQRRSRARPSRWRGGSSTHPVAAGLARLRDPSPNGVKAREALIEAIEFKNTEFNAQGTELNQRYKGTGVSSGCYACDPAGELLPLPDGEAPFQSWTSR